MPIKIWFCTLSQRMSANFGELLVFQKPITSVVSGRPDSHGVPPRFSKHAIPDWPLSLRCQVKKLTTANTIAMWCEWIKVIPIFLSAQQKICFLVCCRISVISLCAVLWKSLEITAALLIPALSGALTLPLLSDTCALSLWFFSAQPNLSSSFLSLSLHFTLAFLLHLSVSLAASE